MSSKKILIVDDESSMRELLLDFMKILGYEGFTVESGELAIQEVRKNHYDVVLTDLLMPGMDGIDVVREVKAIMPDTIVIVMTAHGSMQTAIDSMREGAFDFISKPFNVETLRVRIDKGLQFLALSRESEEYKKRATTDGLTGLWNFAHFQDILPKEIERSRRYKYPLSLVMIDLDNFKLYNDTFGHVSGNRVLVKIAKVFLNVIRRADMASRYGGEEFVVVLPHTEKRFAHAFCDRLRKIVESTHFEGEESMPGGKITISSGVATFPDDADDSEELIERADMALYAAKRAGRNVVCSYKG